MTNTTETRVFTYHGYCYWYDKTDSLYLKGHKPDDEMALIIPKTEFENKYKAYQLAKK